MDGSIIGNLDLLLRLTVSTLCGAAIGFERGKRLKEAGIRTHTIVALGAALIMLVSKYGFFDVLGLTDVALDPSRVASQVVSGIGFLGAGMIFVHHQSVNGLTTAAGIWATAGVGMAVGSGMYLVGVSATAIVIGVQVFLHLDFPFIRTPSWEDIDVVVEGSSEAIAAVRADLERLGVTVGSVKATRTDGDELRVRLLVSFPDSMNMAGILKLLETNRHVISIRI